MLPTSIPESVLLRAAVAACVYDDNAHCAYAAAPVEVRDSYRAIAGAVVDSVSHIIAAHAQAVILREMADELERRVFASQLSRTGGLTGYEPWTVLRHKADELEAS